MVAGAKKPADPTKSATLHKKLDPPRGETKDEQFPVYLACDHTGRRVESGRQQQQNQSTAGKKKEEKEGRGDGLG
jgi:hypothetical protein